MNIPHKFCCLLFLLFLLVACSSQPKLTLVKHAAIIMAFGDSLTVGVGTSPDNSYPSVLSQLSGYSVINAGVSGDTTAMGLARLPKTLDDNKPALVLLCLGGNDFLRKLPAQNIENNLQQMITMIKQHHAEVVLIAVPQPSLTLAVPELFFELAEKNKIPLEDKLLRKLLRDPKYKSDGIHLNQQGYYEFAIGLDEFLRECGALPKR